MVPTIHPIRVLTLCTIAVVLFLSLTIRPLGRGVYAQGAPAPLGIFGDPTEYTVTVNSCSVSTDGVAFTTVFNTPVSFDIASVAAGAKALDFATAVNLPSGTYTTVRCVVGQTAQITAQIISGITTYYTNAVAPPVASIVAPAVSIAVTDPAGDTTLTIALGTPFVIAGKGTAKEVRVGFTLENSMELFTVGGDFFILPRATGGIQVTIALVP